MGLICSKNQDNPRKRKRGKPTKLESVPGMLREKIWRYLDQRSKLAVRQVCSEFKKEIDLGSGLDVFVNDYDEGNLEFVRSVEAIKANILHVDDTYFYNEEHFASMAHPLHQPNFIERLQIVNAKPGADAFQRLRGIRKNYYTHEKHRQRYSFTYQKKSANYDTIFRCKWNLEEIDVWGFLTAPILLNVILPCSFSLHKLAFKSVSLMIKTINPLPRLAQNLKPQAEEYWIYDFPNLKTLAFHYGYFNNAKQDFHIFNANMIFILRTFLCPKLSTFHILPDENVLNLLLFTPRRIPHKNLHWETNPLKYFIHEHRKTLRSLDIVLYRTTLAPLVPFNLEPFRVPKKLTEYGILLPNLNIGKENVSTNLAEQNFWQHILTQQNGLKSLTVQVELWNDFTKLFTFMKLYVIPDNLGTLTKIYIQSYHRKSNSSEKSESETESDLIHKLDFAMFRRCKKLRILHVTLFDLGKVSIHETNSSTSSRFIAINLGELSQSLEDIEIIGVRCHSKDLLKLAKIKNLNRVTLMDVGEDGDFGITYPVAKAFLLHTDMEYIRFRGFNRFTGETKQLVYLIIKFYGKYSDDIELTNPHELRNFTDFIPCLFCLKPHG